MQVSTYEPLALRNDVMRHHLYIEHLATSVVSSTSQEHNFAQEKNWTVVIPNEVICSTCDGAAVKCSRCFDGVLRFDDSQSYIPAGRVIHTLPFEYEIPEDIRELLRRSTIVQINCQYWLTSTSTPVQNWRRQTLESWDLCESYIRMGYLPPVYLAEHILDTHRHPRDPPIEEQVLVACRRSMELTRDRCLVRLEHFNREREDYKERNSSQRWPLSAGPKASASIPTPLETPVVKRNGGRR